ncbi:hypothetical protein BN1723_005480 [Verticillium longisporum]|uniref:Uncharacterized protein n=1 Tax=Verticillium longisporum TaxID=100787 RepID=A0A0G4M4P2_VERLO|nr:Siderophore triacetylfusarinine C esterase like protein [Verticillium longisporum]KAG7149228.1 Siderophore triacetylfusarinine C esterase like protein [Verticillium longisporum]CRK29256.1 hypothetical protein BN1708_004931 [Verticillium longisporum]CRK43024.1 hypothetical protein BN1723_005480 [Verticillium longisporum]
MAQGTVSGLPCAESWTLSSDSGDEYLIQIGYPRNWTAETAGSDDHTVPVIYLTDGNSVFLTALEALHRWLSLRPPGAPSSGVVVAIGYPLHDDSPFLFNGRRSNDLTPPLPGAGETEGGADQFLDFIEQRVRPFVSQRVKEKQRVSVGREALCGHSYGGLFALHALFTRPTIFDYFLVTSPSIWWNKRAILKHESGCYEKIGDKATSVMLFVGGDEQEPPMRKGEKDEDFEQRRATHIERRMVDNLRELYERLRKSGKLAHISLSVYEGEDHGTVIPCGVSKGVWTFLDDWPCID